jgi:hypothetical protein
MTTLPSISFAGGEAGLERDVHLDDAAAQSIDDRDRGRLRDLLDGEGPPIRHQCRVLRGRPARALA